MIMVDVSGENEMMSISEKFQLPGKNCGACGYRTCDEFGVRLADDPEMIKRCIFLAQEHIEPERTNGKSLAEPASLSVPCGTGCTGPLIQKISDEWNDSLGRGFDFILEHFPEEPGPREIILPHNPMLTRELDVQPGEILIGRPLGMSCGCPITHCGVAMNVDQRTGVVVWCVTGPLNPRQKGYKDLGYYIAEGYEGLIYKSRKEIKIGIRYYFQPHMCMLQWRHSGLVNYLNRTPDGLQVRVEGLWIG